MKTQVAMGSKGGGAMQGKGAGGRRGLEGVNSYRSEGMKMAIAYNALMS
jgi:hypothetical protein